MKDELIARFLYMVLGVMVGSTVVAVKLNKDFAPDIANAIALTYFRGCTWAMTDMYNHKKIDEADSMALYGKCQKNSQTIFEVLEKNL